MACKLKINIYTLLHTNVKPRVNNLIKTKPTNVFTCNSSASKLTCKEVVILLAEMIYPYYLRETGLQMCRRLKDYMCYRHGL